jgi:hypothetical protein
MRENRAPMLFAFVRILLPGHGAYGNGHVAIVES